VLRDSVPDIRVRGHALEIDLDGGFHDPSPTFGELSKNRAKMRAVH
jgi:hypothetical protein